MFSLEIECDPDDRDLLIAELWEQRSAGIVELDAARACARSSRTAPTAARCSTLFPGAQLPRGGAARLGAIGARPAAAHGSGRALLSGARMARRPRAAGTLPHRRESGDGVRHGRSRNHAVVHGGAGRVSEARHARARRGHRLGHSGAGGPAARGGEGLRLRYGPGSGGDCGRRVCRIGGCRGVRLGATWWWPTSARRPSSSLRRTCCACCGPAACCWRAASSLREVEQVKAALPPAREVRHKGKLGADGRLLGLANPAEVAGSNGAVN